MFRAMRLFATVLLAAAGLSLAVVPAEAKAPDKTVTGSSSGGSIKLKKGAKLTVKLTQNSDGGYQWLTKKATNAKVLKLVRTRTVVATCDTPPYCVVGAPTTFVATYKAVRKGRTNVSLVERRTFESSSVKPIAKFKLAVRVVK